MIHSTTFNLRTQMYNQNKNAVLKEQANKQNVNLLKSTEYKSSFKRGPGTTGYIIKVTIKVTFYLFLHSK